MASIRIAETQRAALQPVNPRLLQQFEAMVDLVRRRVGPDHAGLFAEPVSLDQATGPAVVAWFAEGEDEPIQARALSPENRARLELTARRLTSELVVFADALEREGPASRDLARLLRDSLVVPGEDALWSVDGRPVLVGWGHRSAAPAERRAAPGFVTTQAEALDRPTDVGSRASSPDPTAPPPTAPRPPAVPLPPIARTRGWPAAVAWLAAVLLLVALGDRLVRACAVGALDWPAAIRALLPDACPAPAAGDAPDAATLAQITGAEADLRGREIDLMRRALACAASCPPVSPVPERRAEIPAPVTADMDRRLEQVERGRGLELTLAWEGAADLDLHVSCPGGDRIAFDRREACGARLVADLNASGGSPEARPIEHIIWDREAPPDGTYEVAVSLYDRHGDTRPAVPYRIVVWRDGRIVRQESREIAQTRTFERVFSFVSPLTP